MSLYQRLRRSVFVLHVDSGSCNGCDIEILDTLAPHFDVERFGVKLVASPKHADVLLVSGPVTRQFARFLRRVYEYTPPRCAVVAIGACACGGGIWHDTYSVMGGVDRVIPVDVYVPGCPPRPSAIVFGVLLALEVVEQRIERRRAEVSGEGYRPLYPSIASDAGFSYRCVRDLYECMRRFLGYRVARKVLLDLVKTVQSLGRAVCREDLSKCVSVVVRKWSFDDRVREALQACEPVLRGCLAQ